MLGGKVSGSSSITSQEKTSLQVIQGTTNIFYLGGTPTSNYGVWQSTVYKNPAFLRFPKQEGLVPLSEFVPKEFQSAYTIAFNQMAAMNATINFFSQTSTPAEHPSVSISVPYGYKLLGGGASVPLLDPGQLLTASYPVGDATWFAASKDQQRKCFASVTAYACCLYDPFNVFETYISPPSISNVTAYPSQSASVPPEYCLVGGGAFVNYGDGYGSLLYSNYPSLSSQSWNAASKQHLKPDAASIEVYAVGLKCKDPNVKLNVSIFSGTTASMHWPSLFVSAPESTKPIGGGAQVNWNVNSSDAGNLLIASAPLFQENGPTLWQGASKDHIISSPETLTVYALGLSVSIGETTSLEVMAKNDSGNEEKSRK